MRQRWRDWDTEGDKEMETQDRDGWRHGHRQRQRQNDTDKERLLSTLEVISQIETKKEKSFNFPQLTRPQSLGVPPSR